MAGSGKRFVDAGYSTIKPLIKVQGKSMVEYVVNLFPGEDNFLFICSNEHLEKTNLKSVLLQKKPQGKVMGINRHNKGPVLSVLEVLEEISDAEPVIFSYCDYNLAWDYQNFKNFAQASNADGIVVSYTGFHPHLLGPNFYAGVKTNGQGQILEIKEKYSYHPDKLKGWHSCGMYYFKSGGLAKKYFAQHAAGRPHENGEYYISTVYNDMIKAGLMCLNYPVNYFCQWGTPEDLKEYETWMQRLANGYKPSNADEEQSYKYWSEFLNL